MEPHEIQYEGKYEVGGAMEKNAGVRFFVYSFNLVHIMISIPRT